MYDELHRPQFHFSPRHSWMNDPMFAARGLVSASFCFLPAACDMPLELYADGGSVRLVSLAIHELNSAWPQAHATGG